MISFSIKFQSTHPHGVRQIVGILDLEDAIISIHAPAWGATRPIQQYRQHCQNFNPRTRMGCDYFRNRICTSTQQFQSTHPHGVRLLFAAFHDLSFYISIHAPAWGATRSGVTDFGKLRFQSTHPHGVRLSKIDERILLCVFQSTHPHGVRPDSLKSWI